MKFQKRVIVGIVAGLIGVSALAFSASAYGSDNYVPFSFNIPGNGGYGYSSAEYRGDSGSEVPWMVEFTFSSEGRHTLSRFYLRENIWNNRLSEYKRVQQSSPPKYFQAFDTARNKNVNLAAIDNNPDNSNYTVAGYWDEETANHNFSSQD